ncbi:methyltransferase [Brumicola blandensis]|uniref:Ribosomal RNA small subunit methyltransferase C n=1 Tax=Brumicola blandensis TaxID=3075611 RepID=A0AAW8R407_9ALTE|nr:methyltransferase [Alteromonas sp. W409]MDT0583444.1 methyltransferase [Alteromonas sp. W409]
MLSLPSQLILRNTDLFSAGHWALVNPTDCEIFAELREFTVTGLHQFHDVYSQSENTSKFQQVFAPSFNLEQLKSNTPLNGAIIYLPKAKQQLEMLIANIAEMIVDGGQLLIVGENKAGIKSVGKLLEKVGENVNKIDGAKHCGLVCVEVKRPEKAAKPFDIKKYGVVRTYSVNGKELKVFSLPGVFGHKQFDPGTQLLLQQFEPRSDKLLNLKGQVLDFACGTGIIGTYLALMNQKVKVTMSDVSALAVYCAEQTLSLNSVEGKVIASDGMKQVDGTFDHVVSNPPFHTGVHTNYTITQQFIAQAHKQTRPRGTLDIVANKFLPYSEAMNAVYFRAKTLVSTNKFNIYEAAK